MVHFFLLCLRHMGHLYDVSRPPIFSVKSRVLAKNKEPFLTISSKREKAKLTPREDLDSERDLAQLAHLIKEAGNDAREKTKKAMNDHYLKLKNLVQAALETTAR